MEKFDLNSGKSAQDSKSISNSSVKSIVRLKYEMCKNFRETGACKYGDRCLFAHGDHELINRAPAVAPEDKKESSEKLDSVKKD